VIAALDPEVDPAADDVTDEAALEVADAFDREPVELDHDVTDTNAGGGGRSGFEQLDDLEPTLPPDAIRDRLRQRACATDDAEERSPHAAVDDEALEDPARAVVDRDGKAEADPGDGRVDPDDATTGIRERSTGVARVECRVRLDDVLDHPACPAVARRERPSKSADDAGCDRPGEAQWVADRHDQLADT
jgi:hypothetical protein